MHMLWKMQETSHVISDFNYLSTNNQFHMLCLIGVSISNTHHICMGGGLDGRIQMRKYNENLKKKDSIVFVIIWLIN